MNRPAVADKGVSQRSIVASSSHRFGVVRALLNGAVLIQSILPHTMTDDFSIETALWVVDDGERMGRVITHTECKVFGQIDNSTSFSFVTHEHLSYRWESEMPVQHSSYAFVEHERESVDDSRYFVARI